VRDLRAAGVMTDIIFARADHPVDDRIITKMSLFCDLDKQAIVALPTAKSVYEVPLTLEHSGIADYICAKLGLPKTKANLKSWQKLNDTISDPAKPPVRIGIVAKYMDHEDTYMSVTEAIKAAAWAHGHQAKIVWIDAEKVGADGAAAVIGAAEVAGIIVPGGFGSRGVEGKIAAAAYARDQQVPYLGLCLGMQVAVIAVARQAFGDPTVNTTEVDPDAKHPVIALMDAQRHIVEKGGTMRLGNYPCKLAKGSKARQAYGKDLVEERHRHRYEFNNIYRQPLAAAGLDIVGTSPDDALVEIIELADHPFFVASQFHPEFTSRPQQPNPLFDAFMGAVTKK